MDVWRVIREGGWIRLAADAPLAAMLVLLHAQPAGTGGAWAAGRNAMAFVAFAALHSLLARGRPKALLARLAGAHRARAAYAVLSALGLAGVLLVWTPLAGELWHARGPAAAALTAGFAACAAGMVWAASFVDYPAFLGITALRAARRGLVPAPPPFSARGPYAHCRHPMYGFLILTVWVGPVMSAGRLEFAALATLYILAGTHFEEQNLRAELGPVYDEYRAHVPMWIPRSRPWRSPATAGAPREYEAHRPREAAS
jgi:protein-S-isoprenylcysteine O-methyltransferase Ste14